MTPEVREVREDEVCSPAFEPVRRRLDQLAARHPDRGYALAAHHRGELVLRLGRGPSYGPSTLQSLYSAGKGAAALCVALLVDRGLLAPEAPVRSCWPGFGSGGAQAVSVAQLLSHQSGLVGVDGGFSWEEYVAHEPLAGRLARQRPFWEPGEGHGYHAFTLGTLTEELVRRTAGLRLAELFLAELGGACAGQLFLSLPEAEEHRWVPVRWGTEVTAGALRAAVGEDPVRRAAYNLDADFPAIAELSSRRDARASGLHAATAVGSALGLAALYGALSPATGDPVLSAPTVDLLGRPAVTGPDRVLGRPSAFSLGLLTPCEEVPLLGPGSFGHDGTGGCVGAYHPELDLAVGFTTDWVPQLPRQDAGRALLASAAAAARRAPG